MKMDNKAVRWGALLGILALVCAVGVTKISADPGKEAYLLRVEVESQHGDHGEDGKDKVSISAPVSLFNVVFDLIPSDAKKILEDKDIQLDKIFKEMEKLQGQDFVRIRGPQSVRIWLSPVTDENRKDVEFLKVNVVKTGKENQEISVCVPEGLIQMVAGIAKALGVTDKLDIPALKELQQHKH